MGLTWQDVGSEAQTLAIRQTRVQLKYEAVISMPKTQKGRLLVALDPATTKVLSELRE